MHQNRDRLLRHLLGLTFALILLQMIYLLIHFNKFENSFGATLAAVVPWGDLLHWPVVKGVLFWLFAQALCYASVVFLVYGCAYIVANLFHWSRSTRYWFGMGLFLWTALTVFLSNIVYFPHSVFSLNLNGPLWTVLWWLFFAPLAIVFALCATDILLKALRKKIVLLLVVGTLLLLVTFRQDVKTAPASSPNIIIIGLDAYRADCLEAKEGAQHLSPNIDNFVAQSVQFTHAYTPLGRTFPAWVSILTGLYPVHSGARYDLDNPNLVYHEQTLASALQARGYATWFATDETRFSNIDEAYGFEHGIHGPIGLNDFLMGSINDFPLSNLVVNTRVGEFLFPHSYANRAASVTYQPHTFVEKLQRELPPQSSQPMLLAMHLLLAHWPNDWANSHFSENTILPARYLASVQALDQQFGEVIAVLQQKHLLENAIVIVLSDHGEALGLPGDRILQEKNHMPGGDDLTQVERVKYSIMPNNSLNFKKYVQIDSSYGHGTDVLSFSQNQVLLAWRFYGRNNAPKRIQQPVSLIDITPTVFNLLSIKSKIKLDGVAIDGYWQANAIKPIARNFYFEDGYKAPALQNANIDLRKLLSQAINMFQLQPDTGRVVMKDAEYKRLLPEKSFAVMSGHWLLANYPGERWYLINMDSGQWSGDLQSTFAQQSPARALKNQLEQFKSG